MLKFRLLLKTAWLTLRGLVAVMMRLKMGIPQHDEIHVSLEPKHLDRYLLGFVRYASRHRVIVIQLDRKILTRIGWNQVQSNYGSQILNLESVRFSFRKAKERVLVIDDDYFHSNVEWRWPLGLHPNFEVNQVKERRNWASIVFFGTPSDEYTRLFDEEIWGMPNRKRQYEALIARGKELQLYGKLPMSDYVTLVKQAGFVVCLPGFVWPLCHGLYETIHLGAIPILHKNYLSLLPSHIQDTLMKFSYDSLDNLTELLESLKVSDDGARFENERLALKKWAEGEFGQESILSHSVENGKLLLLCPSSMNRLWEARGKTPLSEA